MGGWWIQCFFIAQTLTWPSPDHVCAAQMDRQTEGHLEPKIIYNTWVNTSSEGGHWNTAAFTWLVIILKIQKNRKIKKLMIQLIWFSPGICLKKAVTMRGGFIRSRTEWRSVRKSSMNIFLIFSLFVLTPHTLFAWETGHGRRRRYRLRWPICWILSGHAKTLYRVSPKPLQPE